MIKDVIKRTFPIFIGYFVVGMTFGMLLEGLGYNFIWALICSFFIYAGSMQFVMLNLLEMKAGLLKTAFTTVAVNARYGFYGISLIDKFKNFKIIKPYMIHAITDETYSILVTEKSNDNKKIFLISLFDQLYWISGCVIGNILSNVLNFNKDGFEFSMTAMFVCTFIDQFREKKNKFPQLFAGICSIVFIIIFGSNDFIFPALSLTILLLFIYRKRVEGDFS